MGQRHRVAGGRQARLVVSAWARRRGGEGDELTERVGEIGRAGAEKDLARQRRSAKIIGRRESAPRRSSPIVSRLASTADRDRVAAAAMLATGVGVVTGPFHVLDSR